MANDSNMKKMQVEFNISELIVDIPDMIEAFVFDSNTGAPVASASFDGAGGNINLSGQTDSNGCFKRIGVHKMAGGTLFVARAYGYEPAYALLRNVGDGNWEARPTPTSAKIGERLIIPVEYNLEWPEFFGHSEVILPNEEKTFSVDVRGNSKAMHILLRWYDVNNTLSLHWLDPLSNDKKTAVLVNERVPLLQPDNDGLIIDPCQGSWKIFVKNPSNRSSCRFVLEVHQKALSPTAPDLIDFVVVGAGIEQIGQISPSQDGDTISIVPLEAGDVMVAFKSKYGRTRIHHIKIG